MNHEYMVRYDKDVFEESNKVSYYIEISTDNFECYSEIKNTVQNTVNKFERKEEQPIIETAKEVKIGMMANDMSETQLKNCLYQIAERHGGLFISKIHQDKHMSAVCRDGATIETVYLYSSLCGRKFDELWLDHLPDGHGSVDICFNSVVNDRTKIHLYKELDNATDCNI